MLDFLELICKILFWWPYKSQANRPQSPKARLAYWITLGAAIALVILILLLLDTLPAWGTLALVISALVLLVVSLVISFKR